MALAAKERDVPLEVAVADADAQKQLRQIRSMLDTGVGAIDFESIDIEAVRPLKRRAIDAGAAVMSSCAGPSTTRLTFDFYEMGQKLGLPAAEWITTKLGGKAKVIHFAHGQFGPVMRDRGVSDAVGAVGDGVQFIEYFARTEEETTEGSYALTKQLLEEHPDIDVWLGPDRMMVGAYAALEEAGALDSDRTFLGGFDAHPRTLEKLAAGTPYRVSIGLGVPLFGYALGHYMADWLEGRNVPQVVWFTPQALTSVQAIERYQAALTLNALPETFAAITERAELIGNISYDTRGGYLTDDF